MTKKEQLATLKKRIEELKPIVKKGFKTSEELQEYKQNNIEIFNEYYEVYEQIEALEWELKTPAERKFIEEQRKLMKLKREGKL